MDFLPKIFFFRSLKKKKHIAGVSRQQRLHEASRILSYSENFSSDSQNGLCLHKAFPSVNFFLRFSDMGHCLHQAFRVPLRSVKFFSDSQRWATVYTRYSVLHFFSKILRDGPLFPSGVVFCSTNFLSDSERCAIVFIRASVFCSTKSGSKI